MASGHVNRIKRPNTWLQRPMLQNREESSCQTGAVHTWHIASLRCYAAIRRLSRHSGLWRGVGPADLWVHGLIRSSISTYGKFWHTAHETKNVAVKMVSTGAKRTSRRKAATFGLTQLHMRRERKASICQLKSGFNSPYGIPTYCS